MINEPKGFSILITDDEKSIRITIEILLKEAGYDTKTAGSGEEALEILQECTVDLLITDLRMKGMNGIDLMEKSREISPTLEVVFISAYSDVTSAVKAIKLGAFDYLIKSFSNEELLMTVEKVIEKIRLVTENKRFRRQLEMNYDTEGYLFRNAQMQLIIENIKRIAKTNASVLLTGESGTGKEVLAKIVHSESLRKDRKFSVIDCSAIPENLIESELFGYEKGSFTGAGDRKIGKFEAGNGGTIFIDEIGELSLPMQSKFLRVLQEKKIERVGGVTPLDIDVRIIAATNKDLQREVQNGKFREDLFYRLNICHIKIPPLRNRKEDIPVMAENFLRTFAQEYRKNLRFTGMDVVMYLLEYEFPGNIRELRNMIEQAVIMCDSQDDILTLQALTKSPGGEIRNLPNVPADESSLRDFEKYLIANLYNRYGGNKNKVAKTLGIKRQTLYHKLAKYGIV